MLLRQRKTNPLHAATHDLCRQALGMNDRAAVDNAEALFDFHMTGLQVDLDLNKRGTKGERCPLDR